MSRRVALIHGWGGSYAATWRAAGWDEALRTAGFEPYGIDLPGHGTAAGSHDPADYADLASDLSQMLPEGLWGCIGFSLGTKLLLELEIRARGRNGRLVLGGIGDNLFAPEAAGPELVAALRGRGAAVSPVVQALIAYARASASDPLCLAAVLDRPANPRIDAARLARARSVVPETPILLVNSAEDRVAMPDSGLRQALHGAAYLQIGGPGHIGLTSDPRFKGAALAFLAGP